MHLFDNFPFCCCYQTPWLLIYKENCEKAKNYQENSYKENKILMGRWSGDNI